MTSTPDTSTTDTTSTTAQRDIVELVPGLPLPDIERELATASRSTDVGHRTVAFYLDEIQQRQLFNITAHASAVDYAVKRMKIKRRQARDLHEVGRVLHDLPVIDAAFLAGNLNWTTVRELSKVATAATEADWLDHTKDMTTRQLEHAVKSAERGRAPRDDGIELAKVTFKVQGKLRLLPYEKWELAKQKISAERDEPVTDARFMEIAAELVLSTRDDGSVPGREPVDDSLYRLVIRQGGASGEPQLITEDGPLPIDRATAETIACDARHESDGDGKIDQPIPDWLRKRIRARDGFKCRCCDGRRQLMVHHIFEQSRGGEHASENLVLLCMPCHARVHSNLLVIEGTPATGLRFLDRTGRSTNAPAATAPDVLRMQIQAPATIAVTDGARAPLPLTFATLPSSMDAADWRRHAHLFSWNDRRGTLELRDGLPVEVHDAAASSQESVSLSTLVGQERVIQNLTVAIEAAQLRQSVLPHVLLSGGHGLGKTTIARAVATEMNAPLRSVSSPLLKEPSGIVQVLTSLRDKECLFIDEVQSLPRAVAETLYEALQDGKLSLHVSAGTRSKMLEIRLCTFTLIGATTDEGALPAPLRSRFAVRELLESYDTEQLRQLLCQAATAHGIPIEMAAAELLATVSDGTPREALSLLVRARDQAQVSGTAIDLAIVERTLAQQGIDRDGLRLPDRKALARLARGGAVSLKSLADSAGVAERTFAEVYEPGLIRRGLIAITPHGRIALHRPA